MINLFTKQNDCEKLTSACIKFGQKMTAFFMLIIRVKSKFTNIIICFYHLSVLYLYITSDLIFLNNIIEAVKQFFMIGPLFYFSFASF